MIGSFGLLQKAPTGGFDAVKHLSIGSKARTLVRPRAITLSTQNLIYTPALDGWIQVVQAMRKTIGHPEGTVVAALKPALQLFPYAPIDQISSPEYRRF